MLAVEYRPDIDGLRAAAVLFVVVFHFRLFAGAAFGFMGVDIFFVISGFLITSLIVKELDASAFSFGRFYARRIRRLAPALFATLALTVLAGYFLLLPDDFADLARQGLWSQLYLANMLYWQAINYFGLHADQVFLLHTWSLAVEEQFYLLFPVLLVLAYRYRRGTIWPTLGIALLASFLLNILLVGAKPNLAFYLLPTRAWELLLGSLACRLSIRWAGSGLLDHLTALAGVASIGLAAALYGPETEFPGYFALLPTVGAACLIVSGRRGASVIAKLLSLPPVVYIGRISYSLYLVHWPINIFAAYLLEEQYSWSWRAAMALLAIAAASALYHLVEMPFRRRAPGNGDGKLVAGYALGLLASVLGFATVLRTAGLPQRFDPEVAKIANFVNDKPRIDARCEFDPGSAAGEAGHCRIGASGMAPDWLIFGDSHAWAAYAAFDRWLRDRGQAAMFVFRHSCLPVDGVSIYHDHGACRSFTAAMARLLTENPQIGHVFLVSTWRQVDEAVIADDETVKLNRNQSRALFSRQFAATLARLQAMGKQVVIWEPVPGAKANVPKALARAAMVNGYDAREAAARIAFDRGEYEREFAFVLSSLEENRSRIAARFSPSQVLCGAGKCRVEIEGKPLYIDNGHLSASFADFWAGALEQQLGQLK